jgi:hypothetical protein
VTTELAGQRLEQTVHLHGCGGSERRDARFVEHRGNLLVLARNSSQQRSGSRNDPAIGSRLEIETVDA